MPTARREERRADSRDLHLTAPLGLLVTISAEKMDRMDPYKSPYNVFQSARMDAESPFSFPFLYFLRVVAASSLRKGPLTAIPCICPGCTFFRNTADR